MQDKEQKTAAVLGVGSIGAELVTQLSADGRHVKALMRNPNTTKYTPTSPDVEVVKADITDDVSLIEAFTGVDEVYITAADFTHGLNTGKGFERARKVNEYGVTNVVDAACIQGVRSVVLFSSEAVYGIQNQVDENSQTLSTGTYGATKRLGELALFNHQSFIKRSVVRPVSVLGPRAEKWSGMLFERIAHSEPMGIGDGSNRFNFVDIRDVAGAAIAIADAESTDGQIYNLASDRSIRMKVLLDIFSELAGRDPKYSPSLLALGAARIAEILSATTNFQSPIDTQMVRLGISAKRDVSNQKIKDQLGYSFIPPEQTIYDSLVWVNEEYDLQKDEALEELQPEIIQVLLDM